MDDVDVALRSMVNVQAELTAEIERLRKVIAERDAVIARLKGMLKGFADD